MRFPKDQMEWEIRIAAATPARFFAIADAFYRNTKADHNDKDLWHQFFEACREILIESPRSNSYRMLLEAKPKDTNV